MSIWEDGKRRYIHILTTLLALLLITVILSECLRFSLRFHSLRFKQRCGHTETTAYMRLFLLVDMLTMSLFTSFNMLPIIT